MDSVARKARIAPGAVERLLRGRVKFTDRLAGALNVVAVDTLSKLIGDLEHELAVARATRRNIDASDLVDIQSALEKARRLRG